MKKLLSFLLVLCFSLNVMAGSTAGLERAMDEYQFALTVEWDQKDQKIFQAKTDAFFAEMAKLMSEQGLTQAEVVAVAEKKMHNKVQLEALKLKLALAGKAVNSAELAKILQDSAKDMYSAGASWNGDAVEVLGVIALVAIVGYAIWFSSTHECVAWDERWECSSSSTCDDWGCDSFESCGWEDYCTQYVKKD